MNKHFYPGGPFSGLIQREPLWANIAGFAVFLTGLLIASLFFSKPELKNKKDAITFFSFGLMWAVFLIGLMQKLLF